MFENVDEPNLLFQTHRPEDHPDNHLADGVQSAMLAMMNKLRMVRILLSIHILIVEHSIITHISPQNFVICIVSSLQGNNRLESRYLIYKPSADFKKAVFHEDLRFFSKLTYRFYVAKQVL